MIIWGSKMTLRILKLTPKHPTLEAWQTGAVLQNIQKIMIGLDDKHWYGGGLLVHQRWPLEQLAQFPAPFVACDNGATGLSGILHPFWWTSDGKGLLVEDDDFTMSFNAPLFGQPHTHSFMKPAPFDERPLLNRGVNSDGALTIEGDNLTLRTFNYATAREVIEAYWETLTLPDPPPFEHFERPLWTTWANFKNTINHDKIVDFAQQIVAHGFAPGLFGIDAMWQEQFGDTHFDPVKFPDPSATVASLHDLGFKVTVWSAPFVSPPSSHFEAAQGYAVKTADGQPYIGDWWEGQAALIDISRPDTMAWHLGNLRRVVDQHGLDGVKMDAGEGMFYQDPNPGLPPNQVTRHYLETIAAEFPWSDVRSGWRSQDLPLLFRQWDKSTVWGYDNGLASCITGALTLNMLGYIYSFPDMIGGNAYYTQPTAELMIRWTQAVAPMPIIQFSLAPWDYGEECAALCARYARLHAELAPRSYALAQAHQPIVRPLWWLAPDVPAAQTCADQYLIGDDLLVAPVIEAGVRKRSVYLPAGEWQSYWDENEVHQGGRWLVDYPAPLDTLPLFIRRD